MSHRADPNRNPRPYRRREPWLSIRISIRFRMTSTVMLLAIGLVDSPTGKGASGSHGKKNIRSKQPTGFASFTISLRQDDTKIIKLIQSYWECGGVYYKNRPITSRRKSVVVYHVAAIKHLTEIIIPHFDEYHLHAKKSTDYKIWREGVILIKSAILRKNISNKNRGHRCWRTKDIELFKTYHDTLRENRIYRENKSDCPININEHVTKQEPSLFDYLE